MAKKQRERGRRGDGGIYPFRKYGKLVAYAASVDLGVIDGKRCIGHGEGTWDLITTDFS